MIVKTIINKEDGQKWEIFKKSDNEYFYKYYEFFSQIGWKYTGRDGDHTDGYLSKECIESEFEILIA